MAVTDIGASILAKLRNQAKDTGLSYQVCLQLFCQEEFLRKLSKSEFSDNLILKGGMFLYTLTEFAGRPTRDIDFIMRRLSNDIMNIQSVMVDICQIDTGNDYITMEVVGTEQITPEKKYPGVKTRFIAHIKNVRIPFSIDVGVDDMIVPSAIQREICTRLPGFDKPLLMTYSLESTIAEKLDAIIKRMSATSRMKDFYDIYYLSQLFDFDGEILKDAINATITHRKTKYSKDIFKEIKAFVNDENMTRLWNNYVVTIDRSGLTFDEVLNQIALFLNPVFTAFAEGADFTNHWDSISSKWN